MEYSIERPEGKVKITLKVSKDEWNVFVDRVYKKNGPKINIPGFRKGHAPRHLIEKLYGARIFFDDAFELCFRDNYAKVLQENQDLYPVEAPHLDIIKLDENGAEYTLEVALKPEPVLGDYKGLKVDKAEYPVTEADVDAEIEKARQRLNRKTEKETAAADGDTVNLDYSGAVDGVKFDGGTAKNQELKLGSGSFIPGFEAQLVGVCKGETKEVNVTFPEDYHAENLKGKAAVFTCTVHHIYSNELPELNDAFASEAAGFATLKEYRDDIKRRLKESNDNRAKNENENALVKKVVENAKVEIPDGMVDSELDYMLQEFAYRLMYTYNGMKLDDYFKYTKTTHEDFKASRKEEAKINVKTRLVLEKIIETEKLDVTDEELEAGIAKEAEQYKKTVEEYKADFDDNRRAQLKNSLMSQKLVEFLTTNNSFVKKAAKKATAKTDSDN